MEKEENKILQVGDVIYKTKDGRCIGRLTIDRVSNTMAFSGHMKFNKITRGTWVDVIGAGKWNSYYTPTEELRSEFEHNLLLNKITHLDWSKFSPEAIKNIYHAIVINQPEVEKS